MSDDRERMERLAQTIVDWHNRHPLARRIRARDVHTVGVVALPFMRSTPAPKPQGTREPVLTDVVEAPRAANVDAALAASLAKAPKPGSTLKGLELLGRLMVLVPGKAPPPAWAAFDEAFLPGVKVRAIERFALGHGYPEPPASREAMPWRVVAVKAQPGEGWPFELYTLSAGIDAGPARTRVLAGRGNPAQILGRRALDPLRVALAALAVTAVVGGLGATAWWFTRPPAVAAPTTPSLPTSAASAASSPLAPASAASVAAPPEPASAASAATGAGETPSENASQAASGEPPDIRPRLVPELPSRDGKPRPPLRSGGDKAASAPEPDASPPRSASAPAPATQTAPPAEASPASAPISAKPPADPRLSRLAQQPTKTVVALVGPPGSKPEAEALLKKMQAGLTGMVGDPAALQAQVLETPDGWRATVWPFTTREQAQLINAVLVARGLKTKAVDF